MSISMSMSVSKSNKEELKLETLRLFQAYQKTASPDLRNRIVYLNFGLVRKEAFHWVSKCNESYEDLQQVGCLGLIRAIEKFNPQQGNAFSSFAIPYIRGEIRHYLRDRGSALKIPRRWLDLQQQQAKIIREFQKEYNRQPTDREIADRLNISEQEWQDIKLAYQNRELLSLDASVQDETEKKTSLGELVIDLRYRSFQLAQEDQIRLQLALDKLEERTRQIVEYVFLHDLTYKEAAESLNISVVTVARRIKKGISFLKEVMGKEEYRD